jgi:hypothetical protein
VPDAKTGGDPTKNRGPWFLGLVHGHLEVEAEIKDKTRTLMNATIPVNAGLVVVIPAARVYELLNSPALEEDREIFREEYRKRHALPKPD